MEGVISHLRKNRTLVSLYIANLFVSAHFFLIIYINSSTLKEFLSDTEIGIFYALGSILSVIFFISATKLLNLFGGLRYFIILIFLEFIAVTGLTITNDELSTIFFLLLHLAAIPMLSFTLDVFFENIATNEKETGELRGIYLTLASTMLVIAPSVVGFIMQKGTFHHIYLLSAILLIPLFILSLIKFRAIPIKPPQNTHLLISLRNLWKISDLRFGVLAHFVLQFFYAWMVIYLPIYLTQIIGFTWTELGALFTIMLLPFLLFEIPVGYLADKVMGEKELMIGGFSLMAISAALILIPKEPTFIIWAGLLFMSRVGASVAEITTESYFFKHTHGENADFISIFRMTRPLSYLIAPVVATISLSYLGLGQAFWVLAIGTMGGGLFALYITDTK